MIDNLKNNRSYINRLRNDPRTKRLFDSFIYQAEVETRATFGEPRDEREAQKFSFLMSQKSVQLAMSFVLDNDMEYQKILEHNSYLDEQIIKLSSYYVPTMIIKKPEG